MTKLYVIVNEDMEILTGLIHNIATARKIGKELQKERKEYLWIVDGYTLEEIEDI